MGGQNHQKYIHSKRRPDRDKEFERMDEETRQLIATLRWDHCPMEASEAGRERKRGCDPTQKI